MASSSNQVQTVPANPAAAQHPESGAAGAPPVDLPVLAQKVYELLRRELRLDYERLGPRRQH